MWLTDISSIYDYIQVLVMQEEKMYNIQIIAQ